MQRSALCRSQRELSNAYFLAKFCLDTAENEPCQFCPTKQCSSQRVRSPGRSGTAPGRRCRTSGPAARRPAFVRRQPGGKRAESQRLECTRDKISSTCDQVSEEIGIVFADYTQQVRRTAIAHKHPSPSTSLSFVSGLNDALIDIIDLSRAWKRAFD